MKYYFLLICIACTGYSCTRDRDLPPLPEKGPSNIAYHLFRVNEMVVRGSVNMNEFGSYSDWFEIYNTSSRKMTLELGKWYVTDDLTAPTKYELPQTDIPAQGFLVVWCDRENTVQTQIHSSFALNSLGEQIGIFYRNSPEENPIAIDSITYPGDIPKGYSYGMVPDGSDNWFYIMVPTPGHPNQLYK